MDAVAKPILAAEEVVIQLEHLVVECGRQGVGKAHRLDLERRVGPPPIFDHDLGHETLDERVTDAAIDRSDEIQPVRGESRRQVRHVDDATTPQTARR